MKPDMKPVTGVFEDPERARIVEVFSSLQGEGIRLGESQIFVRFGGCNLCCDYCDEPETIPIPSGEAWTRRELEARMLELQRQKPHRSVSWTGGEPLLHRRFLRPMMQSARGLGLENYLETNGVLHEALADVAELCDVVAMDVKLPSSTGRETWAAHAEFLRVAPSKTFVKVVLTAASTEAEWGQVLRLLEQADPSIPLVLQPATPIAGVNGKAGSRIEPPPAKRVEAWLDHARRVLKDVRVLPQQHPLWGIP